MGESKRRQANKLKKQAVKGEAPTHAEINRIIALFNSGHYPELEIQSRLLVEKHPDFGFAWKALGASLQMQGKDALSALQKAVELLPDDAEAHYNLGKVLRDLGQLDSSVASYRRALVIKPGYAMAHNNLGNALRDLGQLDSAAASYRMALEINPNDAVAHNNLGITLKNLGQLDDAVASCRRALEIKPHYAEAYSNLGNALRELGRLSEAEASHRRALEIKPDSAEAHNNLGSALRDIGKLDEAAASYRRALEIKPDFAEAHSNLGNALQAFGQLDSAVASYRQALEIKPDFVEAHSSLLFIHNYLIDQPAAMLLDEAKRYGELMARQALPDTAWRNIPDSARCLRVGLISGDLRAHPVGYFLESVLTARASGRLEFFAYSNHSCNDAVTERIKACCCGWHSTIGLSDETLARQIRADSIDILIDLSGHTSHNRLSMFAWRPAPVQASWLGYFATTGVAAMDYLIADPWTVPEAEESNFTEEIWRLPETYLCFTSPDVDVQVAPLPAFTDGYITFGCFNNLTKMNDAVVALWARVLLAVPGSRLFLKTKQLGEAIMRQSVLGRFAAHGIDAGRLIMEGVAPRAELLAAYHRVDIALDPFPYPGGTTSVEGLWMGVPVLTLAGERFLSHIGESILQNAGLPEWIASDADDYVARAVLHASDLQYLAALRNGLRQQALASPLFDAPRFARHFEAALRGMWRKWCDQQQGQPL